MQLTDEHVNLLRVPAHNERTLGTGLMVARIDAMWEMLVELETLQVVQRRGKLWFLTVQGEREVARLERTSTSKKRSQ